MQRKSVFQTFLARFLILGLNFGLVILSTNLWGSEGKGIISIIIADLALAGYFSCIFAGSSVSFFSSKIPTEQVLLYAYIWSVLTGLLVPVFFYFTAHSSEYLVQLIVLTILSSILTANINFFIGKKDIRKYNLYTVLQQGLHVLFILFLIFALGIKNVSVYFTAHILVLIILVSVSCLQIFKNLTFKNLKFEKVVRNQLFRYGYNIQFSSFLQFLNYRLSYYFIEFFRGIAGVGIFSVGVAVSEAIWTISKSLSLVLYSEVLNTGNQNAAILKTKIALKMSFLVTAFFLIVTLLIPAHFYTFVFGNDFTQTKRIILLLSPGILAIAVSNIIGFYFAGINKLKILNMKSMVGLIFTIPALFIIVPKWGISGACVVTSLSYCISSAFLFYEFYRITEFHIQDYIFSRDELKILVKKFTFR